MTRSGVIRILLVLVGALGTVGASPPTSDNSIAASTFWAGIDYLGMIFKAVGSLGGGAESGRVWIVDLATGQRHPVSNDNDLAWPVLGPDGSTIFALRGRQVVRLTSHGGETVAVGPAAEWRKLVGVDQAGDVLGLLAGRPWAQPVLLTGKGELLRLPQPETEQQKTRVSMLLQEDRIYADGRQLMVTRSQRGGRGYDVNLAVNGATRNLSDCGDDACGQPSLSPDGGYVLYIHAEAY